MSVRTIGRLVSDSTFSTTEGSQCGFRSQSDLPTASKADNSGPHKNNGPGSLPGRS